MKNIKEITYNNKKLLYKIKPYSGPFGYINYETIFYHPTPKIKTRKKYYLFGKKIKYPKFMEIFTIYCNIENPIFSKKEIKLLIEKKFKIYNRKKEIKKGEII